MSYRLSFNCGMAEPVVPGLLAMYTDVAGHPTTPRHGYHWWFWLPSLRCSGRLDRFEVLDVTVSWLCYWCSLTAWPKQTSHLHPWFHSSLDGLQTAAGAAKANPDRC